MEKFAFLIGQWKLEYHVPQTSMSEAMSGKGHGVFQFALNYKFVTFDYSCSVGGKEGQAHGIFGRDGKTNAYRYWWFESSGAFMTATCQFLDERTLYLNWHDCLLRQTFKKISDDEVILQMEQPVNDHEFELVLEVVFYRENN